MNDMAAQDARAETKAQMSGKQVAAISVVVGVLALGLAVYAAAASYESLSHLALKSGVPLARLNPISLDGGLAAVILFDITLTLIWKPIRWMRFTARLFAAGTIAANAYAGWPDVAGVGLRIAAPTLFVIIVEGIRTVLLRRGDKESEDIPTARWILAPVSTFTMWRRMKLWRVPSYAQALDLDLERREAIDKLVSIYGPGWKTQASRPLVRKLQIGVKMEQAIAEVEALTAPEPELQGSGSPQKKRPGSTRNKARGSGQKRRVSSPPAGPITSSPEPGASSALNEDGGSAPELVTVPVVAEQPPEDMDTEAQALKILTDDPEISGSELGRRLGKSERYGCILKNKLVATVAGPETGSES